MNTFKTFRSLAAVTVLALLSGFATPVVAQDVLASLVTGQDPAVVKALERSDEICSQISGNQTGCMGLLKPMLLKEVSKQLNVTPQDFIRLNEKTWGGVVNANTTIPALLRFKFKSISG